MLCCIIITVYLQYIPAVVIAHRQRCACTVPYSCVRLSAQLVIRLYIIGFLAWNSDIWLASLMRMPKIDYFWTLHPSYVDCLDDGMDCSVLLCGHCNTYDQLEKKLHLITTFNFIVDVSATAVAFFRMVLTRTRPKSSTEKAIGWMDRWIKEAIHIRKEQDKSMNRDEGSYQHLWQAVRRDIWRWTEVIKTIPKKATAVAETSTIKLKVVIRWSFFSSLYVST